VKRVGGAATSELGAYDPGMKIAASVFVVLAALLHVYIFWMESVAWTRPEVWKRFSVADQAAADVTRPMAYNQGFYNLFLAVGAALGLVLWWTGRETAGTTLALFSTGSMVAAATVLVTTGRRYLRAALSQGTMPLIGLVLTLLA
jgi:putative membrane protein